MEFRSRGPIASTISPEEIHEECNKLLYSNIFSNNQQLQKLVAFMVRRSLTAARKKLHTFLTDRVGVSSRRLVLCRGVRISFWRWRLETTSICVGLRAGRHSTITCSEMGAFSNCRAD